MIRLLVTGGRTYDDADRVNYVLDRIHASKVISVLAHGATPTQAGADWLADAWAERNGVAVERFPVDHALDGPWPAAGPRRNARMFDTFKPDNVLAFPGGRGTASMIRIAHAGGIGYVWLSGP